MISFNSSLPKNTVNTTIQSNQKTGLLRVWLVMTILLFLCISSFSANAKNNVSATLVSESASITEDKDLRFGVILNAANGWHTYWKEPGDAGLPTKLEWQLPEGFSASEIDWPEPTKFIEEGLITYGYTGTTLLPVTISPPTKLNNNTYNFTVKVEWLACNNICIPESQTLHIELPVGEASPSPDAKLFPQNKATPTSLPSSSDKNSVSAFALLATLSLALLGGLVLNIMPCVLPILSLKTLALVKKSGQVRSHTIRHGIAYTLGILASFATIAAILIILQQGGEAIGWGFQMQSPAFVGFLIYLLFLVGLSLSGAFHLPVLLGGIGGNITHENSMRGSFFTGILATMVATPCTAPFMASAVGAALTMPAWAAMLTFLSLGFGLALPFLLISIFPNLLRFLPKPGAWMEKFKELLAFPMYAAVIWLIWVLGMQVGVGGITLILCGLLLVMFIVWIERAGRHCNIYYRVFIIFSAGLMLAAILFSLENVKLEESTQTGDELSIPYSAQTLAQLRLEGKAVYVDATAAWCITCQLNKHIALDTKRTQQAFKQYNVVFMVADWTRKNPQVTELLHGFGYNGVPLNIFYPKDGGEPIILPQILSEDTVIKTISQ
jgi:thiol:disulfide interchange protein